MNPSPAPGLVDSWFTWAFVLTVVAVVALVVLTVEILKAREVLSQERLDAVLDEPWEISGCTIEDCPNVGVQLFHANHGFIWVCHQHAPAVTQWTGPAVFDQDESGVA